MAPSDPNSPTDTSTPSAPVSTDTAGYELPRLPLLDDASAQAHASKPTWRGWIHAGTFPVAIAAGIVLIALSQGAATKWASAVFMASSLLLFGISALYHRIPWRPKVKLLFRRLDHANIFLLIAGTYTPLAVAALHTRTTVMLLSVIWAGALLGIGFRVFWTSAPRWLYVPLYVALGWGALGYLGPIASANVAAMVLIVCGGVLYTLGAVAYGFKKPNPWPGAFGFHEIFHMCTVLAFLCHWTGILLVTLDPVTG